jgi:hypothetical protein
MNVAPESEVDESSLYTNTYSVTKHTNFFAGFHEVDNLLQQT